MELLTLTSSINLDQRICTVLFKSLENEEYDVKKWHYSNLFYYINI